MFLVSNKGLSLEILPDPYSWPKMYKRQELLQEIKVVGVGGGGGVRRRVVQKTVCYKT